MKTARNEKRAVEFAEEERRREIVPKTRRGSVDGVSYFKVIGIADACGSTEMGVGVGLAKSTL